MKVKFTSLHNFDKGDRWRDISFQIEVDGIDDEKHYNIICKRWDDKLGMDMKGEREYEVSYIDFNNGNKRVFIYRDTQRHKKKIDNWKIGGERGIDVFERIEKKIEGETKLNIWDNGFWEGFDNEYTNKIIEI